MGMGTLTVQVHTGEDALPVANAEVTVYAPDGRALYRALTDVSGNTIGFPLPAPDKRYTLDPTYLQPAYAVYDVVIRAAGYATRHIHGVEIVDTQTTILPENLSPLSDE